MSQILSEEGIRELLYEDIPDLDCPSDLELEDEDDEHEEIRPQSPLNNFDTIFNSVLNQENEAEEIQIDEPDDDNNQDEVPIPSTSKAEGTPKIKKLKRTEPNRRWKKKETETRIPDYPHDEDRLFTVFNGCQTATDIFLKILRCILDIIVFQTNLYATQKGKTLRLQENEFLSFLGVNMLMGYHELPSKRHYWSNAPDLHVPIVAETMTRDRFDEILSCLHVNDNENIPANCTDKLYKLRPMIEAFNKSFMNSYDGTRQLSVDESIILFKGRSSMKQYNPMKPIKRGYKLWCVADLKGYIFNFDIYQGKNDKMKNEFMEYGLGERVVLSLTKNFWGSNRIVCFDNYFNSVGLVEKLKMENILACGTIRHNRRGVPEKMTPDKQLQWGDHDYRVSEMGISFFKWHDNKAINFIANFHSTEITEVKRTQKDGTKKNVPCPTVVADYNKYMGGVDQADRYRVLYGVNRKSKKWWHRIFFGLIDIAFVNAFIITCEMHGKMSVLDARRQIAMGLITYKDMKKTCRRSAGDQPGTSGSGPAKRRKSGYTTLKDVWLGNLEAHWPKFNNGHNSDVNYENVHFQ
ncbi:piggyBac transposable element-derived protein 3-like [Nilaparvata lugens]|uniref:piggyBac transposable element-derived protein 3-like n=1 Tax=Nilaparvata lugens TaxID=108931 RepID=UPI00193CA8FD|nr:piggyBac transposable element-derived protein 3-like [Nilaparvata lugens]